MFKKVLVALDHSPLSARVVQAVRALQPDPGVTVILAHVMPTDDHAFDIAVDQPQNLTAEHPYRRLEKELEVYQAQIPYPSQIEIVSGNPTEEILRLANIYQADLIILGSRGLTGMDRILQQSVSSQIVSEAICSVLVIQSPGE